MDRGEEAGDLAKRAQLEDRIVERGLPLEQDAAKLDHDAEAERQRHRHRAHLLGHGGSALDHDLGLAAGESGYLQGVFEAGSGAYPGQGFRRGDQVEPDPLALEAANQRDAAALEQLSVGTGEPARGGEGTG